MPNKSLMREGAIFEGITGESHLFDLDRYAREHPIWTWKGAVPDGETAECPPTTSAGDVLGVVAPGTQVRVEKLLLDAKQVKGRQGAFQCVQVKADLGGRQVRGLLFSVFGGTEYLRLVAAQVQFDPASSQEIALTVNDTPLGKILGAAPAPKPGGDEARKYECLKGVILGSRRWERVTRDGDYDSGRGSTAPKFHEGPWEPNILGLRGWTDGVGVTHPSDRSYAGTYCSTIYVLYKDGAGVRRCEHFRAALDCAPQQLKPKMSEVDVALEEDAAGHAQLLPGQYIFYQNCHPDFYKGAEQYRIPGLDHAGHAIWYEEFSTRTGDDGRLVEPSGWNKARKTYTGTMTRTRSPRPKKLFLQGTGIHVHSGRPQDGCRHTTTSCQIFWGTWTNWRYQRFLWLMSRNASGAFQQTTGEKTYTLVDAKKVDGAVLAELKTLRPNADDMLALGKQTPEKIGLKSFDASSGDRFTWQLISAFPSGTAAPGT